MPPLRTFIASDVGHQNEFLRTEALVAILNHKDESVVGLAESELRSGTASYWKSNLLFALTRAVPPSRSIPILAEALALPGPQMRTSAAVAIYQTDSPEGIPPLLQALDDPDPQVAFAVSLSPSSAISLSLMVCLFQPRLACNLSGQELSPTHASLRSATANHDYYFELLFPKEERDAQSITQCSTAHHGDFRAVPRVSLGLWPAKSHEN